MGRVFDGLGYILATMRYSYLLTLLGLVLIAFGLVERGWALLLAWLGADFLILGFAYARGVHGVFGKRPDGTFPLWSRLLFLPLNMYTAMVWHLARLLGREPKRNVVTEQLVVGRRLLPSELDETFDNYVDLTAELPEPLVIRRSPAYHCFPILDGTAPSPEALRHAVSGLRPGRTFVHCAQGHGRTGLFALAALLMSGAIPSVDVGLKMLAGIRPRVRLNREQYKCIQAYAAQACPSAGDGRA